MDAETMTIVNGKLSHLSFAQMKCIGERAVEYLDYECKELGGYFTEEFCEKAVSWAFNMARLDFEAAGWNLRLVQPVERHAIKPRNKNLSTCQKIKLF